MFQQHYLFWLAGLILLVVAVMSWCDSANPRRLTTGLFWALYGLIFFVGDWTQNLFAQLVGVEESARALHITVGVLVVIMAVIAGCGGVRLGRYHQRSAEERQQSAKRLHNKLFSAGAGDPAGNGNWRAGL